MSPQSRGMAMLRRWGDPVSVQGMRWGAGHIRSREAGTWGSCRLPGLGCGREVSGLSCMSETRDLCSPECCDHYWDLNVGPEYLEASAWEDSSENPGAQGLGSSAWRCRGLFPVSEVLESHCSCWAPLALPLGSYSCGFTSQR